MIITRELTRFAFLNSRLCAVKLQSSSLLDVKRRQVRFSYYFSSFLFYGIRLYRSLIREPTFVFAFDLLQFKERRWSSENEECWNVRSTVQKRVKRRLWCPANGTKLDRNWRDIFSQSKIFFTVFLIWNYTSIKFFLRKFLRRRHCLNSNEYNMR